MGSATMLAEGMRRVAVLATGAPEQELERYLESQLAGLDARQRLARLEELAEHLGVAPEPSPQPAVAAAEAGEPHTPAAAPHGAPAALEIHRLVSRFLGSAEGTGALPPELLAETFAASLDTLFESLNQIVSVINVTLLGQSPELETIRKVIGSNLKGDGGYLPIREYLERIQRAFLVAHDAFQASAATVIGELVAELDPEPAAAAKGGLKFGPLRKAELFDQVAERHARCRRWFDSGQFKERLLREFEKECQKRFTGSAR